jgi:hydroxyacylglutathione hydrolase
MATVLHVAAFADNYIWLIRGTGRGVAVVDPGDAEPVLGALARERLEPRAILCTHHHGDHVGGVEQLTARYRVPVYGPARERIAAVTHPLAAGAVVRLDGLEFAVLDVPGHTAGHIAYYGERMLFCGDTLFSAGCGRLFEGTAAQLHDSLARLATLPDDTAVYCAHEYTAANLRFALAAEPDNDAARERLAEVEALGAQGRPSLPSSIAIEKRINPFLRTQLPALRAAAERHSGRTLDTPLAVFTELRRWKDGFRA